MNQERSAEELKLQLSRLQTVSTAFVFDLYRQGEEGLRSFKKHAAANSLSNVGPKIQV